MRIGEIWRYIDTDMSKEYWTKELSKELRETLKDSDEWAKQVRVKITDFNETQVWYIFINDGYDNLDSMSDSIDEFLESFEKDWGLN